MASPIRSLGSVAFLFAALVLAACGDGDGPPAARDAGDLGAADLGVRDLGVDPPRDLGVDGGSSVFQPTCQPCATDGECGPLARCFALPTMERACVPACDRELPSCPRAFECTIVAGGSYACSPVAGSCCIDEDADGYGDGIGCSGLDCNDSDIGVSPAASERCNSVDDDCDGIVDDLATDCGDQECVEATARMMRFANGLR